MVAGEAYRVGQVGSFYRIPLGYSALFGVCTQVGADAAPTPQQATVAPIEVYEEIPSGYRWMTIVLFGEAIGGEFDRGVGMFPTVGDEVHLVTPGDLRVIYGSRDAADSVVIGTIAGSGVIPAQLQLSSLVSRHSCIVGSTGSGKSNLVAVVLEELGSGLLPAARVLVVDPHGEYGGSIGKSGKVIRAGVATGGGGLRVPYWALPFDELLDMTMGDMQPLIMESIRDRVRDLKVEAAAHLDNPPPVEAVTADSPIPFSIRRLWYELEDDERATFSDSSKQDETTRLTKDDPGDPATLMPPRYPAPTSVNTPPYPNRKRRGIGRQLDMLRTRLQDSRFAFMFEAGGALSPDREGKVTADLDSVLADWIGGDGVITVLDVSAVPAEVLATVVGTMLRLIYDALFWAMDLPVGGRAQPLLIVIDEAHRFLPAGSDTPASRTISRIAKEGRKYGVGLMVVTQRPSDVDAAVLSQCGTMIALRVTNAADRSAVAGTIPDDLGGLVELLPSLRTGEALVLGEALQVPSRARVRRAFRKPVGEDPSLPAAWLRDSRPDASLYTSAVANWRAQSTAAKSEVQEGV